MSTEIILTLSILVAVVILFVTEALSADLVALFTLSALAITGLVTLEEGFSGFSSSSVVTIWSMFILSAGLAHTGVASWLGKQMIRIGGDGEVRTLLILMVTAAALSAFMINVGVTALLLPVALDICRRTRRPPSQILIPLAFSSLLGGMTTLIGTPPNILVNDFLTAAGFEPFSLFSFLPFSLLIVVAGILYFVLIGRRLLPERDMALEFQQSSKEPLGVIGIEEQMFIITLPNDTKLDGCTLGESRLGSVLGLNVISVMREGHTNLGPDPETKLRAGDRLLVIGRADHLIAWNKAPQFRILLNNFPLDDLTSDNVTLVEARLTNNSTLIGKNLEQLHFRQQYGGAVLAVWREGRPIHYRLETLLLKPEDKLLLLISRRQADILKNNSDLELEPAAPARYELEKALAIIQIPSGSHLVGQTITASHLGDAYQMGVMGIVRDGRLKLLPVANETILTGDELVVRVRPESIAILESLHGLKIDTTAHPTYADMESETVGLLEVVVSPQSNLPGKTLREIHFREKYGLSVLAIWREGTTKRSGLRDEPLRFGDALLIFGPRDRLHLLASEEDFISLSGAVQTPLRIKRAPIASAIMLMVVIVVGLGLLPISIAAIIGGTFMVLSKSLNMDEAYRAIEWKVIFLIAGMLPLGIAMQNSGTTEVIASVLVKNLAPYGTIALLAGIYLFTTLAGQIIPHAVITVLIAPIALSAATDMGVSPYPFMISVAIGASSAFLSPFSNPSNILTMGPGGYRFVDYLKVGWPLVLLNLLLTVFVLPLIWPL